MKIAIEPRDGYTALHLQGEFDRIHCPFFLETIDEQVERDHSHIVLDLRLLRFLNSTAMGALVKAARILEGEGGKMAISAPPGFCRNVIENVGLSRVIPIFDTVIGAARHLKGLDPAPDPQDDSMFEEDRTAVLFSPVDQSRLSQYVSGDAAKPNPLHGHSFGRAWRGVGQAEDLDTDGMDFTWNGGRTGLTGPQMAEFLAPGVELQVKFRLPLLQRGLQQAVLTVDTVSVEAEGREPLVRLRGTFADLDPKVRHAVAQYVSDMAALKDELGGATDG